MSTRSCIVEKLDNGSFKGTTIHWDGYFSYAGQILTDYYKDPKKVDKLISLGQISGLGKSIEPSPLMKKYGFDYYANNKFNALPEKKRNKIIDKINSDNYTSAYHRDRGENWKYTRPFTWKNASALKNDITNEKGYIDPIAIEYLYLYEDKHWYVIQSDELGLTWGKHLTVPVATKLGKAKAHREKIQYEHDVPKIYKKMINHFNMEIDMLKSDLIKSKRGYCMIFDKNALEQIASNDYTFTENCFKNEAYVNNTAFGISAQFCCDSDEFGMDWKKLSHNSLIHVLAKSVKVLKNKLVVNA